MAGYQSCIDCGWKDGIHNVRPYRYQHPWLVIHRESGAAVGCWSRSEARRLYDELKRVRDMTAEEIDSLAAAHEDACFKDEGEAAYGRED